MDKDRKSLQVNGAFLICALALMREPLRMAGYSLEEGVVLVVQNTAISERVMGEMLNFNAIKVRLRTNGIIHAQNFQTAIAVFERCYKEEAIADFMNNTAFLPVILVKGIIPQELRKYKNRLIIEGIDTNPVNFQYRIEMFRDFCGFITDPKKDILDELKFLRLKAEKDDRQWFSDLPDALSTVAGFVYEYANSNGNSADIKEELMSMCSGLLSSFSRDDVDLDILKTLCEYLSKYLDLHSEVLVGRYDQQEHEFWMACDAGMAVVFDDDFYFIPEHMLKIATSELKDVLPWNRFKQELVFAGALICNTGNTMGFTVKKQFTKPDGTVIRPTVLKLLRNKLDGVIHPDISGRRFNACTSVTTTKMP